MKIFTFIKISLQRIGVLRREVPIAPESNIQSTEIDEETQAPEIPSQITFHANLEEDSDYYYESSDEEFVTEKVSEISAASIAEKIVNEEDSKTSIESSAEEQVKESAELSETTHLAEISESPVSTEADIAMLDMPSTSAQALKVLQAQQADQIVEQVTDGPKRKLMKRKSIDEVCARLAKRVMIVKN